MAKRYQRDNQHPLIEEQTTQWPKDTKRVIRAIVLSVLRSTGSWLPLWYLLAIVLFVLRVTDADYPFGIFWPLCCLFFYQLAKRYQRGNQLLVDRGTDNTMAKRYQRGNQHPLIEEQTTQWPKDTVCSSSYGCWLPLWYLLAIVLSVLRSTDADYPSTNRQHNGQKIPKG
jgi:hypothetical protein